MNKRFPLIILILSISITLSNCAPKPVANMKLSSLLETPVAASADKALVYFVRTKHIGFMVHAAVYNGDEFIGFVPYGRKLAYLAEPGEHLFMVVSEAADFMKADLLPGKTYYVEVVPRMGAWRARFSLAPITKLNLAQPHRKSEIEKTAVVKNKPQAYEWAKKHNTSVESKKNAYFAKWKTKPKDRQPILKPEDGQ